MRLRTLSHLRILIVDGSPTLRNLTVEMLGMYGAVRLERADDGTHALSMLKKAAADLIITENLMKPMDGIELIGQVRALEGRQATVPIIMLTARADLDSIQAARAAGVSHILLRPASARQLFTTIRKVLARARNTHPGTAPLPLPAPDAPDAAWPLWLGDA